jgi:hypothetical protein
MSEALFGLLGTAVGGLAAFGGSWIAARYECRGRESNPQGPKPRGF